MALPALLWARSDRDVLSRVLPEAVTVIPVGATEQHGPHLPTGTDALLADAIAWRAAQAASERCSRRLVVTPAVAFGASAHHLPFGGTLSLSPGTLTAVLTDLLASIAQQGGHRVVLVNGHGGNIGVCQAVAAHAAAVHDLAVAHLDYWRVAEVEEGLAIPGHAGEFETSLVHALSPADVGAAPQREHAPKLPWVDGVDLHAAALWRAIDGFTDRPALADESSGRRRLEAIVEATADRLVVLAETL